MEIYAVGGSVRNAILGIEAKDNDYVVVGATEAEMLALGYERVGNDFPVFLKNGEEYALARTELSTGDGYTDFDVRFDSNVTLEEDLGRRDFTMNAIAMRDGEYVDPYGGIQDIEDGIIRVINSKAFKEDPVRILRMARFAAQLGFDIEQWTLKYAAAGDISKATKERVAKELEKALMGGKPSLFFTVLKDIGQLHVWFPEIHALIGVPQPEKHHAEGDAFVHTMMVLDSAAAHNESIEVRFACLVHDLGKAVTPEHILPAHHGHEQAGVPIVHAMCDNLKLSNSFRKAGAMAAEFHTHVHKIHELNPKTLVKMWDRVKSDYVTIAKVGMHDGLGKIPMQHSDAVAFVDKFDKIKSVKLGNFMPQYEIDLMSVDEIKRFLHRERINAIKGE